MRKLRATVHLAKNQPRLTKEERMFNKYVKHPICLQNQTLPKMGFSTAAFAMSV